MPTRLLDDLVDWLRIPSISTGGGNPADLERAAAWVVARIKAAGGEARVLTTAGNPLAVGELTAARPGAPTVMAYGHYDVQSVGDAAAWITPPFEPDVRDGRVFARGIARLNAADARVVAGKKTALPKMAPLENVPPLPPKDAPATAPADKAPAKPAAPAVTAAATPKGAP